MGTAYPTSTNGAWASTRGTRTTAKRTPMRMASRTAEEYELGTNHLASDSDGDGLPDGDEAETGTDPRLADTDGDGINDGEDAYAFDWVEVAVSSTEPVLVGEDARLVAQTLDSSGNLIEDQDLTVGLRLDGAATFASVTRGTELNGVGTDELVVTSDEGRLEVSVSSSESGVVRVEIFDAEGYGVRALRDRVYDFDEGDGGFRSSPVDNVSERDPWEWGLPNHWARVGRNTRLGDDARRRVHPQHTRGSGESDPASSGRRSSDSRRRSFLSSGLRL